MDVQYVDHMGSDLSVVNAARVSFAKQSDWEYNTPRWHGDSQSDRRLSERDRKLINYLAKHDHWSPFAHAFVSLRMKAPIFVARQLVKHQVGLAWNEESRRYIDDEPEFFCPDKWRKRPDKSIKQGSGEAIAEQTDADATFQYSLIHCEFAYRELLKMGVAPEQARMVLPQSMYVRWIWSGSVMAFARVYRQRIDTHAQKESQEIAKRIERIVRPLFPVSWEALIRNGG